MSETFRVRIGRVRRHGGADVRVIDGKFEWHGKARENVEAMKSATENIVGYFPDMAGFVVMAWDARGRTSCGYRNSPASPVPAHLFPQQVAEWLRHDIAVQTGRNG